MYKYMALQGNYWFHNGKALPISELAKLSYWDKIKQWILFW